MKTGDIIYVKEKEKTRPYLYLKSFKNSAGIVYDVLAIPITSKNTVGNKNLVEIKSDSLNRRSYAKMNNLTTLKSDSFYVRGKVEQESVDLVIDKLLNILDL